MRLVSIVSARNVGTPAFIPCPRSEGAQSCGENATMMVYAAGELSGKEKIKKTDKISKYFPYDKQRLSNIRIFIQFPFTFEYFEHNYY